MALGPISTNPFSSPPASSPSPKQEPSQQPDAETAAENDTQRDTMDPAPASEAPSEKTATQPSQPSPAATPVAAQPSLAVPSAVVNAKLLVDDDVGVAAQTDSATEIADARAAAEAYGEIARTTAILEALQTEPGVPTIGAQPNATSDDGISPVPVGPPQNDGLALG